MSWRQNLAYAIRPPKNRGGVGAVQQTPAAPTAAPQVGAAPAAPAQPGTQAGAPVAAAPARKRKGLRKRGQPQAQPQAPAATSATAAAVAPGAVAPTELAQRRERAAAQLVELQWDLGGLTYEMARRDDFRLDVLVRQAAKLQQVDAELGEIERLLHLEQAGAAGTCPSCGALYARGAVYCSQCATPLMRREQVAGHTAYPAQDQPKPAQPTEATPPPAAQKDAVGGSQAAPAEGKSSPEPQSAGRRQTG